MFFSIDIWPEFPDVFLLLPKLISEPIDGPLYVWLLKLAALNLIIESPYLPLLVFVGNHESDEFLDVNDAKPEEDDYIALCDLAKLLESIFDQVSGFTGLKALIKSVL